jgi:hypothetical protein
MVKLDVIVAQILAQEPVLLHISNLNLQRFCRNNKFLLSDWSAVFGAVHKHPNLLEICDFDWSLSLLAPGITEFKVSETDLGKKQHIMALNALLPRVAESLTKLVLR